MLLIKWFLDLDRFILEGWVLSLNTYKYNITLMLCNVYNCKTIENLKTAFFNYLNWSSIFYCINI